MKQHQPYSTDFLFSDNSLVIGMGSVMNIGGSYFLFNYSETGEEADRKAIESDWGMIGLDLENILQKHPAANDEPIDSLMNV